MAVSRSDPFVFTLGDVITDHDSPFQCSARVPVTEFPTYLPTAQQSLGEIQVTPPNESPCMPGVLGDDTMDQEAALHCSNNVVIEEDPTAQQFDVEVHVTALS